jgi:hypothetical protein
MLRNVIKFLAVLFIITGIIWILQGTNLLPGSFMTGNPQWAINGAITIIIALVAFWFANRKV